MLIGQPAAGIEERLIQILHHQINRPARRSADKAAKRIPTNRERQACMMVVVERAEALVTRHLESESLRDPLNRKVAKLLKFKLIHHVISLFYNFTILQFNGQIVNGQMVKYSLVFVYSPVWFE